MGTKHNLRTPFFTSSSLTRLIQQIGIVFNNKDAENKNLSLTIIRKI